PRRPFSNDLIHRQRLQRRAYYEELTEATVRRWCGAVSRRGDPSEDRDRHKRETEI
ncbi:hypothetical protein Dimus_018297, partial [Dionaea muscipula]